MYTETETETMYFHVSKYFSKLQHGSTNNSKHYATNYIEHTNLKKHSIISHALSHKIYLRDCFCVSVDTASEQYDTSKDTDTRQRG